MASCVQRTILYVLAQFPQTHTAYLFGSAVRNRLTSTSDLEAVVQDLRHLAKINYPFMSLAGWYNSIRRGASIMESATPFCFCTTQKHLSVKIVIISMT